MISTTLSIEFENWFIQSSAMHSVRYVFFSSAFCIGAFLASPSVSSSPESFCLGRTSYTIDTAWLNETNDDINDVAYGLHLPDMSDDEIESWFGKYSYPWWGNPELANDFIDEIQEKPISPNLS